MDGISLSWRSLPQTLIEQHALQERCVVRSPGAEPEIRFLCRDNRPLVPVWLGNELRIVGWGAAQSRSRLPRTREVAEESLQAGIWTQMHPELVDIPANFGWDKGVWYRIRQGVRGILVHDEQHQPIVYLLTVPATHYYQVMTRNPRMPVFWEEQI